MFKLNLQKEAKLPKVSSSTISFVAILTNGGPPKNTFAFPYIHNFPQYFIKKTSKLKKEHKP